MVPNQTVENQGFVLKLTIKLQDEYLHKSKTMAFHSLPYSSTSSVFKNIKIDHVLKTITKTINFKVIALSQLQFISFLKSLESEFDDFPY